MPNLGEMDPMYVGAPNLGEMPPDDVSLLVQAAANAVGQAPGEELSGQVAATLQALGMSPGPVAPTPQMGLQVREMAQPALTPSYAAVPLDAPGSVPPRDVPTGVDRIGADQSEPAITTMAAPPPGMPPEYAAPPRTAAEAGSAADAAHAKQFDAYQRAQDMKFAAEQDRANRVAQVQERAAERQLQLNERYQTERKLIQAKADAEVAAGIQELADLAKKEPNPGRWFENQSFFGQAMWGLALVFGAAHTAITPGAQNSALAMVRQNIANDVEAQRHRLSQEMAIGKMRLSATQARGERNLSDARDDWQREYTRLQALERAWIARETVPGDLDAAAAKQAGVAQIQAWRAELVEKHRVELKQAEEAAAARRFQASQASLARQHAADQARLQREWQSQEKQLDRELQLALAPVDVKVAGAGSARNPIGKDGTPTYYELAGRPDPRGRRQFQLADAGGSVKGDGVVLFKDKDTWDKANEAGDVADNTYTSMVQLRDALKAEGAITRVAGLGIGVMDPEVQSLVDKLGYEIAQSQNKVVTDKDFSAGVRQAIGFDPNGSWLQRGKFALAKEEVIEKLDEAIRALPENVQKNLQKYNNTAINGTDSRILYTPRMRVATEPPPERTTREIEGKPEALEKPVLSAKDYTEARARVATNSEERGRALPTHDTTAVDDLLEAAKGRSPAAIRKQAEDIARKVAGGRTTATDLPGDPGLDPSQAARNAEIDATLGLIRNIGEDLARKQEQKLEKFRANAEALKKIELGKGGSWVTEDMLRRKATEAGLGRALDEVDAIVKEVQKKYKYGR